MKKLILIIAAILYSTLRLVAQGDKVDEPVTTLKFDSIYSWSFEKEFPKEFQMNIDKLTESINSFQKNFQMYFDLTDEHGLEFQNEFNFNDSLFEFHNLEKLIQEEKFEEQMEGYTKQMKKSMQHFFKSEEFMREFEEKHKEQMLKLEDWLEDLDIEEIRRNAMQKTKAM